MESTVREAFEDVLRRRRSELVHEVAARETALRTIVEERQSELEECAQEEQSGRVLARLDDRERGEIMEIDAALDRIVDGSYGRCVRCHGAIGVDRLMVLPATTRCIRCVTAAEPPTSGEE